MLVLYLYIRTPVRSKECTPSQEFMPKPWKKHKMSVDAIEVEILRQLKETSTSTASIEVDNADEDFTFGRTVALTLKRLQPQQKSLAKLKIQQLLHKIEYPPPSYPTSRDYYGYSNYDSQCFAQASTPSDTN